MNTSHLGVLQPEGHRLMRKANHSGLTVAVCPVSEGILGGMPTDSM